MECRPHAETLGMLAMYNVISAIVSYTLTTPFFFTQFRKLQNAPGALLRSLWRRMKGVLVDMVEQCIRQQCAANRPQSKFSEQQAVAGFSRSNAPI